VAAFDIPIYAGFLCTVGACLLISVVALLIAYLIIRRVTGMKLTRKTVMDDIGMLRRGDSSPNGSGPAISNPGVSVGQGTTAEIPPARP
jgi:hypothetical protein